MKLIERILDLLYPPKCTFCRGLADDLRDGVCPQCRNTLPYTKNGGKFSGNFFTACVSPLYYEEEVREAMLRYKFHGMTAYAKPMGKLLADCIDEYIDGQVDIISWVPLSRKRLRSRGYDQARLLAQEAAKQLNLPCEPVLRKVRHTKQQSKSGSADKRKANISGAYEVIDRDRICGKTILLIDDIVTTGSTFSECARMLGMSGAERVYCGAVACKRKD